MRNDPSEAYINDGLSSDSCQMKDGVTLDIRDISGHVHLHKCGYHTQLLLLHGDVQWRQAFL